MGFRFGDYNEAMLRKKIDSKIVELNRKENPEFAICVGKTAELIVQEGNVPTPKTLVKILGTNVHRVTELCRSRDIAYECIVKQAKINLGMLEPINLEIKPKRTDKQPRKARPVELDMPPHLLMNKLLKIYEDDGIITPKNLGDYNFNRANLGALYQKFGCKNIWELEEIVRTEYVFYQMKKEQQEQARLANRPAVKPINRMVSGWTVEEIKQIVADYYKDHRKLPPVNWLENTPGMPCAETVKRYLGRDRDDWLKAIGVDPKSDVCKSY